MSSETPALPPWRLWPGVTAAVLLVLVRVVLPAVRPDQTLVAVLGGMAGAAAILLWWLFFSRAPWADRLGVLVLTVVGLGATWFAADVSISTGAQGGLLPMLALPPLTVALVVWALAAGHLSAGARRATMAATVLLACSAWTLVKTGGFDQSFDNDLMWRWAQTPEDRLVADPTAALPLPPAAQPTAEPAAPRSSAADAAASDAATLPAGESAEAAADARAEWPGFRGPGRDGIVRGVRIDTDWSRQPPAELWRRKVGPGWSSFAVQGDAIYTQEQRGDDEVVASYSLSTGRPLWSHRDAVRFWESNGGAGPRATPTLANGRVYTLGATGVLNVLDARTGALVWSRNAAADAHAQTPMWGFAGSPLVVRDAVIVGTSGTLVGYDAATGAPRWIGPQHTVSDSGSYSSPQHVTIGGVEQVVLLSEAGATGVAPGDGRVLWEHPLRGSPILQPVLTADDDLLIHVMSMDGGQGIRRLAVRQETHGWTATERWTSDGLKTMSSDFVVHNGYAFGFDGTIFACVDLADGRRKWKGGRYGSGQVMLLPDQNLLLIVSEEGELALVSATPDKHTELARVPAVDGKTWNHPVLVGNILLVRNGEEMAAFRLASAK
jgi:outer membrane protein assembly factor BamB